MGGLSRRATLIDEFRREQLPLLLVDSGNLLFKGTGRQSLLEQDRLAANSIVDIYQDLGYSAVAVGPHDLADGPELLAAAAARGFPWVSANLTDEDGKLLFPPWALTEIDGKRIGILGLTGQAAGPGYKTRSWQEEVPQYLEQLFPVCDFLIVLSSLKMEENSAIAQMFPQIHLLITAEKSGGNMVPALHFNTLFSQTHSQGKYLGILEVEWGDGVIWMDALDNAPAIATVLAQQKNDLREQSSPQYPGLKRLNNFSRFIEGKAGAVDGWQGGMQTFRFRSLAPHIEPSRAIENRLEKVKAQITEVNRQHSQQQEAAARSEKAHSEEFAGSAACQSCHPSQYDQWQQSNHAKAYETLREIAQHYNLRCLPCHTTWKMTPGKTATEGFGTATLELLQLPVQRQNVGCESCHGPGLDHAKDGTAEILAEVNENSCLPCHSQQMDPSFRFREKIAKLKCTASR